MTLDIDRHDRRDPVTAGLFRREDMYRFVGSTTRGCEECEHPTDHDLYTTDFFFAGPGISTHGYRRTSVWFLCSVCGEYGFADPSEVPDRLRT